MQSIVDQKFKDWQAIVVNDGSTDATEEIALRWLEKDKRITYYSKLNEGLGKTRNFGIAKSSGEYILPLDSDNLIEKNFAKKAVEILESNSEIGVVHGHAEYFGERTGIWKINEFNLEKILVGNYIDACAIFRKRLWSQVGGYDEKMPFQGEEDWGFWIALGELNVKFYHLNQITFKYFVSSKSMIRSFTNEMADLNRDYLVKKYSKLYYQVFSKNQRIIENNYINLKSEKFIINSFTKMFLGFEFFKK
jgi:glycosyltransferase involved in cell wall biosynthesis